MFAKSKSVGFFYYRHTGLEKSRLKNIDKLESLATENPQLSQAYLNKRDRIRKQMEDKVQLSLENVKRELDKIEGIFDKAEQQLKRSAEGMVFDLGLETGRNKKADCE